MNRTRALAPMASAAACLALAAAAGWADEPANTLTNPSFENADPGFPSDPEGFAPIAVGGPGWNSDFARTGVMSLALGEASSGSFTAWTTNLFDPNGDLYDPPFELGSGDLYVSGWYLIPDGEELAPGGIGAPLDNVGIKLEFRRVPPNFSIYQAFELPFIPVSTTNGEWAFYEHVFPEAMISLDFPPFPGSVTILPFRFNHGAGQEGVIYWDDMCIYQLPACPCDTDGNGTLNLDDIDGFVAGFLGSTAAGDCDGNGVWNLDDIDCFVACFIGGCN